MAVRRYGGNQGNVIQSFRRGGNVSEREKGKETRQSEQAARKQTPG